MPKLQAPLSGLLDEPISEQQVQRIWRNAQAPIEPSRKRRRLQLTAAACALALAVLTLVLLR